MLVDEFSPLNEFLRVLFLLRYGGPASPPVEYAIPEHEADKSP